MKSPVRIAVALAAVAAVAGGVVWWVAGESEQEAGSGAQRAAGVPLTPAHGQPGTVDLIPERLDNPARTVLRDQAGAIVAVLTDGARTVMINGAKRVFSEPQATKASVHTVAWVRLAPQPWSAGAESADWFREWFPAARTDTSPDVLAVATEYVIGSPEQRDGKGVRYAGDASFGPVKATGAGRQEQSDFYDYLGVPWSFPDGRSETADRGRYGAVDCSGYVRLVFGYRLGMPLLGGNEPGPGLPRRAYAIAESGPGVALVPNKRTRAVNYGVLQPGDLVFFEVEDDPETLDHTGIYLGIDDGGHHRFISSRERINGPTLGDVGGTSLLDDGGHYSMAWRAARRL